MQFKPLVLIALAFVVSAAASPITAASFKRIVPIRQVNGESNRFSNSSLACESTPTPGRISYHKGPVLNSTNTYGIFYGSWTKNQRDILINVLKNIGASPYYNMMKSYNVSGGVVFKNFTADEKYSQGKQLTDEALPKIIMHAIKAGLPTDTKGVYFIFTDPSVSEGDFCMKYCGFHTNVMINSKRLLYSFVGNPQKCLSGCGPCNMEVSPNNDLGVDSMASTVAHELVETASDPLGTTWYDDHGYENADKCAYTYGKTFKTPNGAIANIKLGGKNYLIQQNWNAKKQSCAMSG